MQQHRVRIAGREDIPCIVQSLKGFGALLPGHLAPDEELARGVARLLQNPDTDFFVAHNREGRCAGFLQQRYRYSLWLSGEEANIEDVFVAQADRGLGLGRVLVDLALARAVERGCRRAVLDIIESNVIPLALYERMGFSCVRERSIAEGDPLTRGHQLFMVKPLP